MNWRLRVLRGTIYSQLPFSSAFRQMKRRLRPPHGESSNTRFAVADGLKQIEALRSVGAPIDGVVLEMGSGWLPVIPFLFHVLGHDKIILTDTEQLMDENTLNIAREAIANRAEMLAPKLGLTVDAARISLERPFSPSYRAPWAPGTSLADEVDILISRCVFEHVPPAVLETCLIDFRRIVRPGGFMCHIVDNSDHWQHINSERSRVEFLTWKDGGLTERFARLNHYGYNNRLRHSDYIAMLRRTGWEVVAERGVPDAKVLEDLKRLQLAQSFAGRDPQDLAILESLFVARRPTI